MTILNKINLKKDNVEKEILKENNSEKVKSERGQYWKKQGVMILEREFSKRTIQKRNNLEDGKTGKGTLTKDSSEQNKEWTEHSENKHFLKELIERKHF